MWKFHDFSVIQILREINFSRIQILRETAFQFHVNLTSFDTIINMPIATQPMPTIEISHVFENSSNKVGL